MKKMFEKKSFYTLLTAFSMAIFFVFSSCEIGMGPSVDLEAPEVNVREMKSDPNDPDPKTSFDTTIYCKKSAIFSGTAEDNEQVTNVYAEVKYLGDNSYHFLANARLKNNKWTLPVQFPKEGPCWIKIVAEDKGGNYGVKSSKVITLFVDDKAPEGKSWYIDRLINGIQYELTSKEKLQEILVADPLLKQPSNINVAQNVEFQICAAFSDASGIDEVKISIYDENGDKVLGDITSSSSSAYAPRFTITHEMLKNAKDKLKTGQHLLQVRYDASDIVTDPEPNTVTDCEFPLGWFLWWPESDNPKFTIPGRDLDANGANGLLKLHIGDSIGVQVFDDDLLKEKVICTLFNNDNGTTITEEHVIQKASDLITPTESNVTVQIQAPQKPQTMKLRIQAQATSGKNLDETIDVTVSDESLPSLFIKKPDNNQRPKVSGTDSEIEFDGITIDKSGATYLEFVWVPDSKVKTGKKAKAEDLLDSIKTTHATYAPTGSETVHKTIKDGMVIWSAKLTNDGYADEDHIFVQHKYNFKLKLLTDFIVNNKDECANEKYFLVRLSRGDGEKSDTELKLSADSLRPEIKLDYPLGNMAIVDPSEDLIIKFHAEKESNIGMKTSSYKVCYVSKNAAGQDVETQLTGSYDSSKGQYITNAISASALQTMAGHNENPRYKFYAEDLLGNPNDVTYQFVLDDKPGIKSVTSTSPEQNKLGDSIKINVLFSKTVSCNDSVKLKLKGIKNDLAASENPHGKKIGVNDVVEADLIGGTGTTSLIFEYVVKNGDITPDKLLVYNESGVGPIKGMTGGTAHLDNLDDNDNLQAKKTIKMDGVAPNLQTIVITTDAGSENVNGGITYLRANRTITATVTTDKAITVQGAPKFVLKNGDKSLKLICGKPTNGGRTLTFTKTITSADVQGAYKYDSSSCIEGIAKIKDSYGNSLQNDKTGIVDPKLTIDTIAPVKPTVVITSTHGVGNRYKDNVKFKVTAETGAITDYSVDGGSNWDSYSAETTLYDDSNIVARSKDWAGNESLYSDMVSVEVNGHFPKFEVECSNSDGNYKAGTELEFLVNFNKPVDISTASTAYIQLSALNSGEHVDANTKAKIVIPPRESDRKGQYQAVFVYETRDPDEFTLKVAKADVHLDGITDQFGITQTNSDLLAEDYKRPLIHCDGVAPKVKKMEIGNTPNANNVYDCSQARIITLTFTENVQLGTGTIYLRQIKDWAIPPVLTGPEFNTICNAFPADYEYNNVTGKEILSLQDNGLDMEDSEWGGRSSNGPYNTGYHGTGQFVGPYKKSLQGLVIDGTNVTPDISTKYVLDFDMDIWETNTSHYYGKTFKNEAYSAPTGNVRTANDIRAVLEKVHFHERYLSVTATEITNNKVVITFPEGLLGDEALPYGRKWELVIEKGALMDETGNKFGAEADGSIRPADAVQNATGTTGIQYTLYPNAKDGDYDKYETSMGDWGTAKGRGRTSLAAGEKPVVLIKNNGNEYFWSDKVAVPVIRVDRYSYGYGIFQSNASGQKASQIANQGTTKPTAYVRVRIDCETEGATVNYGYGGAAKAVLDAPTTATHTNDGAASYITTNNYAFSSVNASGHTQTFTKNASGVMPTEIFAMGSNDYKKSYKGFIKAKGTLANHTANTETASEGIFQTVVLFENPTTRNGTSYGGRTGDNGVFSIRGTTGFAGEPYIAPFPLRDNQLQSPFVRHTYKERTNVTGSNDYYWISYEILVLSSCSGYGSQERTGNNNNNWMCNWGQMLPGEFTRCTGMKCWN